jgi:hypothetical protein
MRRKWLFVLGVMVLFFMQKDFILVFLSLYYRDKSICKRCSVGELDFLLNKLYEKKYVVVEQKKLEAFIGKGEEF